MAQLTWRNIEAPNISTRDLALANQTINASFGQLAQTLRDREAALRKEAEDQLAVGVYTAKDNTGIDAAIQRALTGNTRERAAARAIAELGNTQRDALMGRQKTQNELDLFQAQRLFGDDAARMYTAGLQRDDAGYARAMQTMQEDAEFGRLGGLVLPDYAAKYSDIRGSADTRFETGQNNLRIDARAREGNAIQSRRLALAEREYNERKAEREREKQLYIQGQQFAIDSIRKGSLDPDSALNRLESSEGYLKGSPEDQARLRQGFSAALGGSLRLSNEERGNAREGEAFADVPVVAGYRKLTEDLVTAQNKQIEARMRTQDPILDISLRAGDHRGSTAAQALNYLKQHYDVDYISPATIDNITRLYPGIKPEHIMGAVDRLGPRVSGTGLLQEMDQYLPKLNQYITKNGEDFARLEIEGANRGRQVILAQARQLQAAAERAQERGDTVSAAELRRQARENFAQLSGKGK